MAQGAARRSTPARAARDSKIGMDIIPQPIPDILLVRPARHRDGRGFFSETYRKSAFAAAGIAAEFVQDNHSLSLDQGVIRGLHFQRPPRAQDKLVRVTAGAIQDIAVDVRAGSPTFGRHVSVILSAENWNQLFVPKGFAHGFCTLEPDTEVFYKVTDEYAPEHDLGLAFDDPALAIDWKVGPEAAILSARDRKHPRLADLAEWFTYEG
jgi:dTDP-4-dehydrorhamnose 3,5-epimerase